MNHSINPQIKLKEEKKASSSSNQYTECPKNLKTWAFWRGLVFVLSLYFYIIHITISLLFH